MCVPKMKRKKKGKKEKPVKRMITSPGVQLSKPQLHPLGKQEGIFLLAIFFLLQSLNSGSKGLHQVHPHYPVQELTSSRILV